MFNNVVVQLICLPPFFFFFCLFSPYKLQFSRQGAYCWVPNNSFSFDQFPWRSILYDGELFCMICVHFFCIEWDHSSSFWDVQRHFASHACLLVASCCLPDPLNAPLCSYVDMAPSAVGHCPFWVSAEVRFIIMSVQNSTNSKDYT